MSTLNSKPQPACREPQPVRQPQAVCDLKDLRDRSRIRISVVLPVFNEVAILEELTRQLIHALSDQSADYEIVYVNDGSSDGSRELLDALSNQNQSVAVVHLARNFGHQAAVHAGIDHVSGDVVIIMDSDLQDDPAAIRRFLDQWENGFDVVYAQRTKRKESLPKRILFYSFYRILNSVAKTPIPSDAGNFGLVDRRVVNALLSLPEYDRYFPGLRSWVGFRQTGIPVERGARHDENPRVSLKGLFRLAKTAIFSFSAFPLTFFYIIAAASAGVCALTVGYALFHKLLTGLAIPGWASTMITASFFGSLNALGISILGEYVIRIYDQVRNRPVYLAAETRNLNRPRLEYSRSSRGETVNRVEEQASDPALMPIRPQVDLLLESLERQYSLLESEERLS